MKIKNDRNKIETDHEVKQATTKKVKKQEVKQHSHHHIKSQLDNQNTSKKETITVKQAKSILRTLGILKQHKKNKQKYQVHRYNRITQKILSFLTKKYRIQGNSFESERILSIIGDIVESEETHRQNLKHYEQIINREEFQTSIKEDIRLLQQKLKSLKQEQERLIELSTNQREYNENNLIQLKKIIKLQQETLQILQIHDQSHIKSKKRPNLQIYIENSEEQK